MMHRRSILWLSLVSLLMTAPISPAGIQADSDSSIQPAIPVQSDASAQPATKVAPTSSDPQADQPHSGHADQTRHQGQGGHESGLHGQGARESGLHGQGGHGAGHAGGDHATTTHRFDDAERWSGIFDDPARDAWQKPDVLVKALALKLGDTVADLGAGTGYFNRHLATAVGASGAVFAVDVEPNLIAHMRARAEREQTPNVIPVLASYDNPRLPRASADVLMLVDTYHHIDARQAYFERVRSVLKPGGRLVVVDFHKHDIPVGPRSDHKLEPAQVTRELEAAGYRLLREEKILPYQYVLIFGVK